MMRRLGLWRMLPPEERRLRLQRVLDRWLRRDPRLRAAGLGPDDPRWGAFERDLRVPLPELVARLRGDDPRRGPLFGNLETREERLVADRREAAHGLVASARPLLERRFDLLGSGPSSPLRSDGFPDWHLDWKSGRRWEADAYFTDVVRVRGDGSDIKVPWELSRFRHLLVLGQARRLAPRLDPAEGAAFASRCAAEARAQVLDWMAANPAGCGPHWNCAMEVALRGAAWTAALALFRNAPEWDGGFVGGLVRALWLHARHVRRNLENDPGGRSTNHYLADLAGLLVIAAALPELRSSAGWGAHARHELLSELERQLGDDGADYERSLAYHAFVVEMLLHAALASRAAGDPWPAPAIRRLETAAEALAAPMRDDGTLPAWGDGDDGRFMPLGPGPGDPGRDPAEILALAAEQLGRPDLAPPPAAGAGWESTWLLGGAPGMAEARSRRPSASLSSVGLHVLRAGDVVVSFSCGPVGTAGLGNHTHVDLLAITVWASGREWIADRGTGVYGADLARRQRFRSVASHATLQVGELEPHDLPPGVDGLFRVDGRARARVLRWDPTAPAAEGEHDGYAAGGTGWIHARTVSIDAASREVRGLEILRPAGSSPAEGPPAIVRWTLAPGVAADLAPGGDPSGLGARLWADGVAAELSIEAPGGAALRVESGLHSPRYGVVVPAQTLVLDAGPAGSLRIAWRLRLPEPAA